MIGANERCSFDYGTDLCLPIYGRMPAFRSLSLQSSYFTDPLLSIFVLNMDLIQIVARMAASQGHPPEMEHLLSTTPIDVNLTDNQLLIAADGGDPEMVHRILQQFNTKFCATDQSGRNALAVAAFKGHDDVVKLLLTHDGVDASAEDVDGRTPLSIAA